MRFLPNMRNFGNFYRDTTPNSISTGLIGGDMNVPEWYYSSQKVTGINVPITLRVKYEQVRMNVYYSIGYDDSGVNFTLGDDPISLAFQLLNDNDTFVVNPNDYINFGVDIGTAITQSSWLEIRNHATGDIIGYCDISAS